MSPADLELGSYSADAPWEVVPDEMRWRRGVDVVRTATRRSVPELIRPRRTVPVRRLATVAVRLARAVVPWAVGARRRGGSESRAVLSRRLREAATDLGPTYIKLGQIISSGDGLFPAELVEEFKRCRDQVPAEPFAVVKKVIEADLNRPLGSVFRSFDPSPLAAASIAQVHRATIDGDDGTPIEVVVKVQRPTISTMVRDDLKVMATLAPLMVGRIPVAALANPPALVELFAETIVEELDFRLEAQNMLDVAAVFAALGQRGYVVPRPHPTLVTRRVLVMERFEGFGFDDVDAMREAGIDTTEVIRTGMRGFTEGCMVHGIFHGDLHGGNLMVLPDGRIGLLDYGITARMTSLQRSAFLRLMITGAIGDIPGQLAAFRDLGALPADTDLEQVIADLGLDQAPVDPTTLSQDQLVAEIQRVTKALLGYGAKLPKILMLYVKNLVFLDGAISRLAPDLDIIGEIAGLSVHLANNFGDAIAADMGVDPSTLRVDHEAIKAGLGIVDPDLDTVTYADLQARRDVIRKRLAGR